MWAYSSDHTRQSLTKSPYRCYLGRRTPLRLSLKCLRATLPTNDTVKNRPKVVESFNRALAKSVAYAQEHPDEVREIVTTYTKNTVDQLKSMDLPTFTVAFDMNAEGKSAEVVHKYGMVKQQADLGKTFP